MGSGKSKNTNKITLLNALKIEHWPQRVKAHKTSSVSQFGATLVPVAKLVRVQYRLPSQALVGPT